MQRQSLSLHWALVLLMYAFVAGLLAGCAAPQTPLQRVVLDKQVMTITANSLSQLIDAGEFTDEEKTRIHTLALIADQSMKIREIAAVKGDDTAYRTALTRFNAVLDELIAMRISASTNENAAHR